MKWGIICAEEKEIALLLENVKNKKEVKIADRIFVEGTLEGKDVAVVQCGNGKVCASMATQILIDCFDVSHLICIGVAGGIDESLQVEDIVIATDAVQHDYNITALGATQGYMDGTNRYEATRYFADKDLSASVKEAAEKCGCHVLMGTVASGDLFIGASKTKNTLRREFGAVAAEMEGAAMAQVAEANGVPFVIVRAISDLADGSAKLSFRELIEKASKTAVNILLYLAKNN